jgi:hypothetical protein
MKMREFIENNMNPFLVRIEELGGDISELEIGEVCGENEISELEKNLPFPLPDDLKKFVCEVGASVSFDWQLPDEVELPEELEGIFGGEFNFDLFKIPEVEESRMDWVKDCFPNSEDSYDKIWHETIAFHYVGNGDLLAFNQKGNVVYLSHDDGEGHGVVMAPSFTELIKRSFPLGFPGPEDWQWLPFYNSEKGVLDPECENASLWKQIIGFLKT